MLEQLQVGQRDVVDPGVPLGSRRACEPAVHGRDDLEVIGEGGGKGSHGRRPSASVEEQDGSAFALLIDG